MELRRAGLVIPCDERKGVVTDGDFARLFIVVESQTFDNQRRSGEVPAHALGDVELDAGAGGLHHPALAAPLAEEFGDGVGEPLCVGLGVSHGLSRGGGGCHCGEEQDNCE